MAESLQRRAFWSFIWAGTGNLTLQVVGFIIGILLARVLTPADYGLVGMIGVFTALTGCLVDCGMANALVRKTDRTDVDCSTLYWFNIVVSWSLYAVFFVAAPYIAAFYNEPQLCDITRVITIPMLIGPFAGVHAVRLTIDLQFKKTSFINVVGTVICGALSVYCAYSGYGVWALVYPAIVGSVLRVCMLWYFVRWKPCFVFSGQSFRELFGFGSKLLASSMLDTAYNNVRPLLVAKLYSGADLGYYTRANQYAALPATTATGLLSSVTYPLLCKLQHDDAVVKDKYRLLIQLSTFIVFPVLMGLAALAEPCVVVLIKEKWLPCVALLQILCFALMWYPVHALNLNLLQVKGRSDLFLRLEIIKKIMGVIMLAITVPISVKAMCYGAVVNSVLCLFVNTYYTGKLINAGFFTQMMDILPSLLLSLAMGGTVWALTTFVPMSQVLQLAVGVPAGVIFYIGMAFILRRPELTTACQLIRNNLRKA